MAYRPPHKRNSALSLEVKQEKDMVKHKDKHKEKEKLKDEFPALSPAPLPMTPEKPLPVTPEKPKMNFASLQECGEKEEKDQETKMGNGSTHQEGYGGQYDSGRTARGRGMESTTNPRRTAYQDGRPDGSATRCSSHL